MGKRIDRSSLIGLKSGKLVVLKAIKRKKDKYTKWLCQCDCGNTTVARGSRLLKGIRVSCGCLHFSERPIYQKNKENVIGLFEESKISFIIDLDDYKLVSSLNLRTVKKGQDYYICYSENKKTIYLHNLLLKTDKHKVVDHINRNTLDNRKENLREATKQENAFNHKLFSTSTSGITGVTIYKIKNIYESRIMFGGKSIYLGRFKNIEDAVIARLKAEKKYFGKFASQRHLFEKYGV